MVQFTTTVTDANGAASHVDVVTNSRLVAIDGALHDTNATWILNDKIIWSNGEVWDGFDFNALNALFEMGSGYP